MTKEDKDLLLKDICARLPYGVQVFIDGDNEPYVLLSIHPNKDIATIGLNMDGVYATSKVNIGTIKPYLRPMSSMTEEEKEYLRLNYFFEDWYSWNDLIHLHYHEVYVDEIHQLLDWFNAHHLDYRGLIEKGLALEAPKGMYNIKF